MEPDPGELVGDPVGAVDPPLDAGKLNDVLSGPGCVLDPDEPGVIPEEGADCALDTGKLKEVPWSPVGTPVASPLETGKLNEVPGPPEGTPVELTVEPEERLPDPVGAPVDSLPVTPEERDTEPVGPGFPVSGYSVEPLRIPVPLEAPGAPPVGAEAVAFEPAGLDCEAGSGVPDAVEASEVLVESPPAPGVVDVSFPLPVLP